MKLKILKMDSRIIFMMGKKAVEISNYKITSPDKECTSTELELKIILNKCDEIVITELYQ